MLDLEYSYMYLNSRSTMSESRKNAYINYNMWNGVYI